jgi:hypothetical protein
MAMNDKDSELKKIEAELKEGGLSRRNFLNRLSAAGVGFGAAMTLGLRGAEAATQASVDVSSTNPAVADILATPQQADGPADEPLTQMAQYYRRFYRRAYRRGAHGYRRFYHRAYRRGYARGYRRFAPHYRRFYVRF